MEDLSRRQQKENDLREAMEEAQIRCQTGTGTREEYVNALRAFTVFVLRGESREHVLERRMQS